MVFHGHSVLLLLLGFLDIGLGLRCLSCKGTLEPWMCNIALTCSQGENACGLSHYEGIGGELRYDTFCTSDTKCSNTHPNTSLCDSCCHGDICNARGCGSSGYPEDRGLICFSCNQVTDLSRCAELAFCNKGDMCAVYNEDMFGHSFHTSKCLPSTKCFGESIIFGKRQSSQTLCGCCDSDFCNDICDDSLVGGNTTTPSTMTQTGNNMEFLLMYPYANSDNLYVLISSNSPGHLDVEVPHLSIKKTIPLTVGRNYLKFNYTLRMSHRLMDTGVEHKGIYMKSNVPVTVSAISNSISENHDRPEQYTEGFMVLPVEKLGRQYRAIRGGWGTQYEMIAIASLYNNTKVNVQFETSSLYLTINDHIYHSGGTYEVTLQRLDTLSLIVDKITGSKITSDKPIAMIGGSSSSRYAYNPNIEFLPPVSKLGTTFIVPSFPETPTVYSIRLLLAVDGEDANVNVSDSRGTYRYRLNYTNVSTEIKAHSGPSYITSTRPIYVTVQTHNGISTPSVLVSIPSVSNYRNNYTISSPNSIMSHDFDQYIIAIIPSSKQSGLMVNNINLHSANANPTLLVNSTNYSFLTVPMNGTYNLISHVDSSVEFGAFIFGKSQCRQKFGHSLYAFPAGFQ